MQVSWPCSKFCVSAEAQSAVAANGPRIWVAYDHKGLPLTHKTFPLQVSPGFVPCHLYSVTQVEGVGSSVMCKSNEERKFCSKAALLFTCLCQSKSCGYSQTQYGGSREEYYRSHGHIRHPHGGSNLPTERVSDILNMNVIYRSFYQVLWFVVSWPAGILLSKLFQDVLTTVQTFCWPPPYLLWGSVFFLIIHLLEDAGTKESSIKCFCEELLGAEWEWRNSTCFQGIYKTAPSSQSLV